MSNKILRLHIDAFGGATNVDIDTQEKSIVALIADGGKGKSSIINFIKACFTGIVPDDAMNTVTGTAKGNLSFEKDGKTYTISISKTKRAETVKIKSSDGLESSKETLRRIVGAVAINPFELQKKKIDDQTLELKKMAKIDTSQFDKPYTEKTKEREAVGRDIRQLEGYLMTDANNAIDLEARAKKFEEEKEVGDLPEKLKRATEHNTAYLLEKQKIDAAQQKEKDLIRQADEVRQQIHALELKLQTLDNEAAQTGEYIEDRLRWVKGNPEIPTEAIQKEIDEINEFNLEKANWKVWLERRDEKKQKQAQYLRLTSELRKLEDDKETYVQSILKDIPGFEFKEPKKDDQGKIIDDRQGPYYYDKTLKMLSTTELVTFAVQFKQAMDAREGKAGLPILILDDFESVGSQGRAEIERLCTQVEEGRPLYQAIVAYMDPRQSDVKIILQDDLKGVGKV